MILKQKVHYMYMKSKSASCLICFDCSKMKPLKGFVSSKLSKLSEIACLICTCNKFELVFLRPHTIRALVLNLSVTPSLRPVSISHFQDSYHVALVSSNLSASRSLLSVYLKLSKKSLQGSYLYLASS